MLMTGKLSARRRMESPPVIPGKILERGILMKAFFLTVAATLLFAAASCDPQTENTSEEHPAPSGLQDREFIARRVSLLIPEQLGVAPRSILLNANLSDLPKMDEPDI